METIDPTLPNPAIPAAALKRGSQGMMASFRRLAGGYWAGETRYRAWGLTLACGGLIAANIYVQFGINEWSRTFFDALSQKNGGLVFHAMLVFAGLATASTLIASGAVMARMRLQVGWRRWVTERMTYRWLTEQRFWRLAVSSPEMDSPEFRIAEDARIATAPVVDFAFGITNAVLMAVVFLSILWTAAGSTTVAGYRIPGFMVFAAIIYSVIMTGSMMLFGRPLIANITEKNASEARLRQELGRVRENAETIAMIRGEGDEMSALTSVYSFVLKAWNGVIAQLARMTLLMNTNTVLSPVVPLLLAAPNFLSGRITLGDLMQTAAAFVQVQVALNWLVDNYAGIAEWLASVGRVTGLWNALGELDDNAAHSQSRIEIGESDDGNIQLAGLTVAQHNGALVIEEADTVIREGSRVLLTGASGTGKSTLIRAIAGLWPWGSGRVLLPVGARIAFMPQNVYLPPGTLRQVIEYPQSGAPHEDSVLATALTRCGLRRLTSRLDEQDRWDRTLSGGEQQRLGFVRLLVQRPDIVLMDGSTTALDADSQEQMMNLLRHDLAACTVITVGQDDDVGDFHDRTITLQRREQTAAVPGRRGSRLTSLLRTIRPRLRKPKVDAKV